MLASAKRYDHFRNYPAERDETRTLQGDWTEEAWPVAHAISRFSASELKQRADLIDRGAEAAGLHLPVDDDQNSGVALNWQLDVFPRLIPSAEWKQLEKGIMQRARAFEAYVADLYGERKLIKDQAIPLHPVLSDPAYHRTLVGAKPVGDRYLTVGAVDLVKLADGAWHVLENHFTMPFGISYALQNRRLLAQVLPELFEAAPVRPIADFAGRLAETLKTVAPRGVERPLIVVLTRLTDRNQHFEESFLARRMGALLVQPVDLVVRKSFVFLRTIHGLAKVDVIYRRIETSSADPVAFGPSQHTGVPGLAECARVGNVTIVNALGCGVADNRAILRHSDTIINYYLKERPLLPTIPTFHGGDKGELAYILKHRQQLVLKPVGDIGLLRKLLPNHIHTGSVKEIENLLNTDPEFVVAQPYLSPLKAPRLIKNHFEQRSVFLRAFVLLHPTPHVMAGGLTRQSVQPHVANRLTIMAEGMKDTWVVAPKAVGKTEKSNADLASAEAMPAPLEAILAPGALPLGSRVAESLYWLGRYLERAENSARMLVTLESVRWTEINADDKRHYWQLWKAVIATTGKKMEGQRPPRHLWQLSASLLADRQEAASVASCLASAVWNANCLRDYLTPEVWQSLAELPKFFPNNAPVELTSAQTRELGQTIVNGVAQVFGTIDRTMPHDLGWRFLKIGQLLDRTMTTAEILANVFPSAALNQLHHLVDDTNLTALLRVLGSLDAFSREYRARAYLDRVARLLWQSPHAPNAIAACLMEIRLHMAAIRQAGAAKDTGKAFTKKLDEILAHIEALPLETIFPVRSQELDRRRTEGVEPLLHRCKLQVAAETKWQLAQIVSLHTLLEDVFFSHQDNEA